MYFSEELNKYTFEKANNLPKVIFRRFAGKLRVSVRFNKPKWGRVGSYAP
jgi:hypothetical protein